jgi:hypothetical protein
MKKKVEQGKFVPSEKEGSGILTHDNRSPSTTGASSTTVKKSCKSNNEKSMV